MISYSLIFIFAGTKLKCPFCERTYGYETNLRAHIRQRHQGIRVPCPFCHRSFTRNNTVRRHIQREHRHQIKPNSIPAKFGSKQILPDQQFQEHLNLTSEHLNLASQVRLESSQLQNKTQSWAELSSTEFECFQQLTDSFTRRRHNHDPWTALYLGHPASPGLLSHNTYFHWRSEAESEHCWIFLLQDWLKIICEELLLYVKIWTSEETIRLTFMIAYWLEFYNGYYCFCYVVFITLGENVHCVSCALLYTQTSTKWQKC